MPAAEKIVINPDLKKERLKCSFDVEEFARYWIGGQAKLDEKRAREDFFLNDPELQDDIPPSYLSHKELYEHSVRKAAIISRKLRQMQAEGSVGLDDFLDLFGGLLGNGITQEGYPLAVHFKMFFPAIMGHGTLDQQAEWLGLAWNLQILGTYAQTELGHGTFVRGLGTRATYDEKTQEFVLHSPSITAYKWWPGGLGHSANYAIVIAQLYTKGQCHGVHPFIVQLREKETWEPLPGIKIGEIGTKLGMKNMNNGYLGFDNVRIPRKNMLMKNAQVLEDGTFVKSPASALVYGTVMYVRVVLIRDVTKFLSTATTIATRYSAVRRQSPIDPKEEEPQVIDHVSQQYKVFPNIARVLVIKLAADYLWDMYNQVTSELERGDLERLPELHALACCLKAVCTSDVAAGIEQLRMACGGHGYMESSNLPSAYRWATAACTYDGENTVMLLQTARYLMKSWDWALQGKSLVPTLSYLSKFVTTRAHKWNPSLTGIIDALQAVSANKICLAHLHLEQRKKKGQSYEHAANATGIELTQCAEIHSRAFLVSSAYEMTKDITKKLSPELSKVVLQLVELYAVDTCIKLVADLVRFTTISESDILQLQQRLEGLLALIRPNAVGIVDGFDIPDNVLCSTLGAYDGNVYERLFAEAQKSPLNNNYDNKAFHSYLKPFLNSNL